MGFMSYVTKPLPRSNSGYAYILVVANYFSKLPLLFPLRKAASVVKIIEKEIFTLFEMLALVVVDHGVQFRSSEFTKLMTRYGKTLEEEYYH